jgi:hypothetical protein
MGILLDRRRFEPIKEWNRGGFDHEQRKFLQQMEDFNEGEA